MLCRYSLEVGPGDTVLIDGPALAQPLFVEMVKLVTEAGATSDAQAAARAR